MSQLKTHSGTDQVGSSNRCLKSQLQLAAAPAQSATTCHTRVHPLHSQTHKCSTVLTVLADSPCMFAFTHIWPRHQPAMWL
jgi:hypothetical protein